jgi:hypothetical protein
VDINGENGAATMRIVGLDCATVDAKVGLALGVLSDRGLEVQQATLCTRERAAASVIAGWVRDSQDPVLIAIDAPLGWPKPLAETLIDHRAGMPIETPANAMFRRTTDLFIQTRLGKRRTGSLVPLTRRWPFSALFAWNLECQFRWHGTRPMFHVSQRSRYIRQPLWLPIGSGRLVTKSQRRLRNAVRLSRHYAPSLQLANQCLI